MDAQTQDTVLVSEKEQLPAPPGWTKKLVPASAKSITLRKYDVVFIAPDGQELKSKWHLTRYLRSHPEGPAISEFSWNSGEEAPIRRSSRFSTKDFSEDSKSTSRKKGKRDATEMEDDPEKAPSGKRAKKAGKSEVLNEKQVPEEVETDFTEKDEVMLEATVCDSEPTVKAAQGDELQENESTDAKLVGAAIKKAVDEESEKAVHEGVMKADHFGEEQEDIKAEDEGLETLVVEERTIVSSANIVGEHEEIQVTVIDVTKSIFDNGENSEDKAAQETGGPVAPGKDLKVEEAAMEITVIESVELLDQELAEKEGVESVELLDQKLAENEGDVSCKVTVVTSIVEPLGPMIQQEEELLEVLTRTEDPVEPSMQKEDQVEPLTQKEDLVEPLTQKEDLVEPSMQKEDLVEPLTQKEDLVEPSMQKEDLEEKLMQKEDLLELLTQKEGSVELLTQKDEQERPTHIQNSSQHIKDKSPSEFGSSPAPLGLANHQ